MSIITNINIVTILEKSLLKVDSNVYFEVFEIVYVAKHILSKHQEPNLISNYKNNK